jgi:hypothetical protein
MNLRCSQQYSRLEKGYQEISSARRVIGAPINGRRGWRCISMGVRRIRRSPSYRPGVSAESGGNARQFAGCCYALGVVGRGCAMERR